MDLQQIDPLALAPNPWNTNQVAPEERVKLKASLKRNGWVKPVLVRETEDGLQILGGAHRVEIALEMGQDSVPVLNLGQIDDQKAKEIGLIDNARYGQDDATALAELLEDLGGVSEMAAFLPIGDAEIAALSTEIDDDDIESLLNDDDPQQGAEKPERKVKTHQVMRFKVPMSDADAVQDFFERVMQDQGFTDGDSLTNAGDALVHVVQEFDND